MIGRKENYKRRSTRFEEGLSKQEEGFNREQEKKEEKNKMEWKRR